MWERLFAHEPRSRRPSPLRHPSVCQRPPPCPHPSNNPRGTITLPTHGTRCSGRHSFIPADTNLSHSNNERFVRFCCPLQNEGWENQGTNIYSQHGFFGFLLSSRIHSVYRTPLFPSWKMECLSEQVIPQTLFLEWQSSLDTFSSFKKRIDLKCW